jgi:glutaredoxin-dependent peroxiredoxin
MAAEVGTKAPDFTLPNQDKQLVSLSASAGKTVVLAFFPAAFTSVCQKELCQFRDRLGALTSANAIVYGISVDTPFALKEFAKQNALTFGLLSDFNKDVIQKYDVVNPDMGGLKGISRRAVVIVDGAGIIRYREVTPTPGDEPHYEKVREAIDQLQGGVRS